MNYDVVIVGGAMSGATLALALASQTQNQMKIAVIEKQAPQFHQQSGFDARHIALSAGSCQRLNEIRLANQQTLWQDIRPLTVPIKQIHISDKGHSGIVEFDAQEFHLEQLGATVALAQVGQRLLNAIEQYSNINYFAPHSVQCLERNVEQVKITLDSGQTLNAKLVVGADGNHSAVSSAVGISQEILHEYGQTAIITNIETQQPHHFRAFERFTAEGPIALLPVGENLMSLVWCVRDAERLMAPDDEMFLAQVQRTFGWRLGKLLHCGKRFCYPLALSRATQHIQERIALVGNAAQTLHPVAGQGFNLGIRDVMQLAKVLSEAFHAGIDLGAYAALQQYERQRLNDQHQMLQFTDNLVSVFANDVLPLQIARNLGLMALAQSSLLRQAFAKPTLGWV
ncbi:2-octaprenyl-6-methoxyphenyl hydroxylase [Aggregatibacter kilianii]|uniref:2-octaprenyl-6-methoxyphenyl hydroxylase n=1 Tax=Aggregatibacter kilianii TaxID=2025884 RepID=UPI000D649BE2|nr:2-octaprenyl-6-methoxyphenyl hydroxylase [Aggregatibacter kilianii]